MQSNNGSLDQWAIVANSSWLHGKRYSIKEGTLIIGRSTQADITLPSNHLSRRHAQLKRAGDALVLQDMASMNGTFVNGSRVKKVTIKPGDQLRFDTFTFVVEGPGSPPAPQPKKAKRPFSAAKIVNIKRPTSPGNRPQPSRRKRGLFNLTNIASALTAACLSYLIYLVFFT